MHPGPLRILVVEDNAADRALYRIYLKNVPDLQLAEAEFGAAGLELCREWKPDCILLDFTLPDVTGLEFINRLRLEFGRMPCALVMLTGIADERIAVRAVNAGATDYIPKSENMEAVLEHSIFNAIDKFRLEKALETNRLELARSEHLHRSLMEALPQLVWTADAACHLTFGNRQWWQYLGIPDEDPGSVDWSAVLHPEDTERWRRAWREGASSTSRFDIEVRLRRALDRQFRWHLIRVVRLTEALPGSEALPGTEAFPMPDSSRWLATCTDIEDQKRSEQAMLQRQKWDSIGLLAGGIAHDFNNLLVGILGGASYVSDVLAPSDPVQPMLQNVIAAGERAAHLTRQLLAYAGKGSFFIQQVDLSAIAEQTCQLVRCSVPGNVHLRVQAAPGLPRIETDSGQVEQVVMNLVLNALEALPEGRGGAVFVRTFAENAPLDGSGTEKSSVVLEVLDNGAGMDAETQARIFDPFFTTKFTGRGLGLAAVQGILRSSGASIEVISAPGKGSTFTVHFPAVGSRSSTGSVRAAAKAQAIPASAPAVLLVDDEPSVRDTCRLALEKAGCKVYLAENGPEGLRCLEERDSEIGILLLDLGMPDMNGREVLEKVRASGRSLPVIVFSGYSEREVAREFEGLGVTSVLQKPFVSSRLTALVAEILNQASLAAQTS